MERNQPLFLVVTAGQNNSGQTRPITPDIKTVKETLPRVDKLLKPVTNAVWDAWLIGLEQSGYNVHREREREKDSMEPEI
jgi:hypothetical protein